MFFKKKKIEKVEVVPPSYWPEGVPYPSKKEVETPPMSWIEMTAITACLCVVALCAWAVGFTPRVP